MSNLQSIEFFSKTSPSSQKRPHGFCFWWVSVTIHPKCSWWQNETKSDCARIILWSHLIHARRCLKCLNWLLSFSFFNKKSLKELAIWNSVKSKVSRVQPKAQHPNGLPLFVACHFENVNFLICCTVNNSRKKGVKYIVLLLSQLRPVAYAAERSLPFVRLGGFTHGRQGWLILHSTQYTRWSKSVAHFTTWQRRIKCVSSP